MVQEVLFILYDAIIVPEHAMHHALTLKYLISLMNLLGEWYQ